jgi:hypothetical protein
MRESLLVVSRVVRDDFCVLFTFFIFQEFSIQQKSRRKEKEEKTQFIKIFTKTTRYFEITRTRYVADVVCFEETMNLFYFFAHSNDWHNTKNVICSVSSQRSTRSKQAPRKFYSKRLWSDESNETSNNKITTHAETQNIPAQ